MAKLCVFCEIIAGRLGAAKVYEDERWLGFLDVKPLFHGHVLLVPKEHRETLLDLDEVESRELTERTQRVARAVVKAMGAEGFFTATNNVVSQSVPHLHVHVVPRKKKDGLRGFFWPRVSYGVGEMELVAEQIRQAL